MSFCVKFSGLISQFRILEKLYLSPRIFSVYIFIFGPFLKQNKIYGAPIKPFELFCFKDTINFTALFFLSSMHAIKNSSGQMRQLLGAYDANEYPPDDWLKTGWQTRARTVDSRICITCPLENNALSVLHYVINVAYITACYIDSRFFLPLE